MNGDRVVARITRDAAFNRARTGSGNRARGPRHPHPRARARARSSARCSRRGIFPTSCRMIRGWCTTFTPSCSRLPARRRRPTPGDKVVVRLEAWESRHVNPEGEIIEVLGPRDRSGGRHAFDHPEASSADGISRRSVSPKPSGSRRTVGSARVRPARRSARRFIVTIDPDDARDFDDAIHVEELAGGDWELGVHIADVSAYVTPGKRARPGGAEAREQRLSGRPRHPDAARSA